MDNPKFTGLTEIGQINIPVRDLETSVEFYRDSLGMEFLFQVPNMAFFDCGGVRILLAVPESGEMDHPGSIIYFKVDDLYLATTSLEQIGVHFVQEPHRIARLSDHELWMSFFTDPSNNTLALMSEVPLEDY